MEKKSMDENSSIYETVDEKLTKIRKKSLICNFRIFPVFINLYKYERNPIAIIGEAR
jgi:hypothetical protein